MVNLNRFKSKGVLPLSLGNGNKAFSHSQVTFLILEELLFCEEGGG